MKTNFQAEEVLTAEDLNANFTECAGKASSDDLHGLENIVQGLENSKADVEHTQAISTITGLQSALDNKLGNEVTTVTVPDDGNIYVDQQPSLLLLDNRSINRDLGYILADSLGRPIYYHLNSSELNYDYMLIRIWTFNAVISSYLIEVIGAWGNPD